MAEQPVLVTGATGHVGSRLVGSLLADGRRVRAMWCEPLGSSGVETAQADVLDRDSLSAAFAEVRAAYYLVHALASDGSFGEEEREGARNFAAAAEEAGVERIVYLGGVARGEGLSEHLRTRQEVGDILRASDVLMVELQTSVVIGDGSASFELVRALVDYLPGARGARLNRLLQPADRARGRGQVPGRRAGCRGARKRRLRDRRGRPDHLPPAPRRVREGGRVRAADRCAARAADPVRRLLTSLAPERVRVAAKLVDSLC